MSLDERGTVLEFAMNDRCAAGTGRFFEAMARVLNCGLEGISSLSNQGENAATITSQCSVFAESEVVTLINEGVDLADIIAGINNAVANRLYSMVRRVGLVEELALTGGCSKNEGLAKALEKKLGDRDDAAPGPPDRGRRGSGTDRRREVRRLGTASGQHRRRRPKWTRRSNRRRLRSSPSRPHHHESRRSRSGASRAARSWATSAPTSRRKFSWPPDSCPFGCEGRGAPARSSPTRSSQHQLQLSPSHVQPGAQGRVRLSRRARLHQQLRSRPSRLRQLEANLKTPFVKIMSLPKKGEGRPGRVVPRRDQHPARRPARSISAWRSPTSVCAKRSSFATRPAGCSASSTSFARQSTRPSPARRCSP